MKVAKDKIVRFTYRIEDSNGDVIERFDRPMATVFMRHNRLYDPVEAVMMGAAVGDEVSTTLLPSDTEWGEYDYSLVFTDSIQNAPEEYRQIGAQVPFKNNVGDTKYFRVTKIDDESISLDGNHPFAGKTLKFFVKILEVRKPTAKEVVEGVASGEEDPIPGQSGLLH